MEQDGSEGQLTQERPKYATDRKSLEQDSTVDFFRAGGPGGQHRNKNDTAVRLKHIPSGLIVTATKRRSQHANLETAFEHLAEKLEALNYVPKKRRPTKPTFGSKEKRLKEKTRRAQTKQLRQSVKSSDD